MPAPPEHIKRTHYLLLRHVLVAEAGREVEGHRLDANRGPVRFVLRQRQTAGACSIRAYNDHWKNVPRPLDVKVVEAVRTSMAAPKAKAPRTEYHKQLLKLVAGLGK